MVSDPLAPLAGVLARQQQLRQLDLCLSTSMIEGWGTQVWPALAGQLTSLRLSLEPHLFSNDGAHTECLDTAAEGLGPCGAGWPAQAAHGHSLRRVHRPPNLPMWCHL